MTIIVSILEALIMLAALCLFGLFAGSFTSKQLTGSSESFPPHLIFWGLFL